MVAKVLAGVGLFLALVAIILKSVALSVPHFVDVHLVNDPNDASDENRLGGVGVFQSEFDSDLEGDILDDITAANVPIITITTPTLEFPLLFPSQENFFATVLPINSATLEVLDAAVSGANDAIGAQVEAVNALELNGDDCTDFTEELELAVENFFIALQDGVIPGAVLQIATDLPGEVFDLVEPAIVGIPTVIVGAQLLASATVFSTADLVSAVQATSCENVTLSSELVIDSDSRICLFGLFSTANQIDPNVIVEFISELVLSEVACPEASGLTVDACISANIAKYQVEDTNIFEFGTAATFGNNDAPTACGGTLLSCNSKLEFIEEVAALFAESAEEFSTGLFTYLNFAVAEGFATSGTFAEEFSGWTETTLAQTFIDNNGTRLQDYQPCQVIEPLLVNQTCDTLQDFLAALPGILEDAGNELAPTVASISGIYATFFAGSALTAQIGGDEFLLSEAPGVFATALIEAGFNTEFETSDTTAEIIQNCADDVEDNEKIAQAQALSIASALFEALSLLLIIAGIILPVEKLAYLAPAAAISGVLGGAFIIGALLVTQSAPVYEGVGDTEVDESGEAEIFFIQGYVPLLALVDAVLFFLSGVVLIAATVFACKESGDSELVNDDVKEDLAMEDKI